MYIYSTYLYFYSVRVKDVIYMLMHRSVVPLSQKPDGYQFTCRFMYPKLVSILAMLLPLLTLLSGYLLVFFGIISDRSLSDTIQPLHGSIVALFACLTLVIPSLIRGGIQRWCSRLLGYTVSFDVLFFSLLHTYAYTYTAVPGQWQHRRDVAVVALAPLSLYVLLCCALFCVPSSVMQSILLSVVLILISGTLCDVYLFCYLLGRPKRTLLYTESFLHIQVFELLSSSSEDDRHSANVFMKNQCLASLAFPWQVVVEVERVGKNAILKEDEDVLVRASGLLMPNSFNRAVMEYCVYRYPTQIYEIACTLDVDFYTVIDTVSKLLDHEGVLLDIKLATQREKPLISIFPRKETPPEMRWLINHAIIGEVKATLRAGFLGFHPTIVTVLLQKLPEEQTQIAIRGIAKDGALIRQHADKKIAYSVAQWLEKILG